MNEPLRFETRSAEETIELGERIGRLLRAGDLVLLKGELGSGKTVLVRGICRAFGCEKRVRSPSFVLVREYDAVPAIFHIDLYRLTASRDWPNLGVEDRMAQGVALVEWGDRMDPRFAEGSLVIRLAAGEGEEDRVVELRWSDRRLEALRGER